METADEFQRRATTWAHDTSLQLRLTFTTAYSGTLHLYALDWSTTARRQRVTADDGSGPMTVNLSSAFNNGAWIHFPIDVAAGGVVTIRADRAAGANAVLAGLFLGGAGSPPPASPPPAWEQGVRGEWVGSYGADGYALLAWNNTSDLVALPSATLILDQGHRYSWSSSTTDLRALENGTQTQRRSTTWTDPSSLQLRLNFNTAYSGTLHLYALDWTTTARRQTVTVDDGSGAVTVNLSSSFNSGAWIHLPIDVAAGGVVTIRADRTAGTNAVLAGLFLGG